MLRTAFFRAALVALALHQSPGWAQSGSDAMQDSSAWLGKQYGYVANNESLRSLLYDFGTSLGVPVIVSTRINVIADDRIPVMSAEDFLAEIHTRFGVIWMYDGTTLYLYDRSEAVGETLEFPAILRDDFKTALDAADIHGVSLNLLFLPAEDGLQISGPPRFVEWGREVAQSLIARLQEEPVIETREEPVTEFPEEPVVEAREEPAVQTPEEPVARASDDAEPRREIEYVIRIFEVQYGYVDEMANNAAGGKSTILSLAEMIAKLMNVAHVSGVVGLDRSVRPGVRKLRGTGVIPGSADELRTADALPGVVATRGAGHEAFVIGDPRLNAVIVRDTPDRMPAYERLIRELDSPVDQIEITVSVLDIDASAAEELRFELESDSFQLNAGTVGGSSIAYSRNLWDVNGLAVRVRALRNSGKSRILTKPSVTTLDNHEASFQNNRTFYVRLGGNDAESVDLAPVSYGWVVRIRPHVIYEGDDRRIQLAIHIEDGTRGGPDLAVTGVPEVSQNVIQTQTVVPEGNSLLIGGYTVREQTRFRQRVPVLGRIPLLGRLFSADVDRDQSIARYFLITPRILPTTVSYRINTGFEGEPLVGLDAIGTVKDAVEPKPTGAPDPLHIGMDNVDAIRAAQAVAKP